MTRFKLTLVGLLVFQLAIGSHDRVRIDLAGLSERTDCRHFVASTKLARYDPKANLFNDLLIQRRAIAG